MSVLKLGAFALLASACATTYTPTAEADRITELPGLSGSSFSDGGTYGTFAQFSGFVNISNTSVRRDIFYWFMESQTDPANDPVILWTNGGPGCSGLLGALTEMGPFRPYLNGTVNGSDTVRLERVPYSWNARANVIFVEQPLMVGYSVSDDPADAYTNDHLNARRLREFIVGWQQKFPAYKANDWFLSAESCALTASTTTPDRLICD